MAGHMKLLRKFYAFFVVLGPGDGWFGGLRESFCPPYSRKSNRCGPSGAPLTPHSESSLVKNAHENVFRQNVFRHSEPMQNAFRHPAPEDPRMVLPGESVTLQPSFLY